MNVLFLSPLLAKSFQQLQDLTRSNSLPGQIEEIEAFADSSDEKLALNVAFHEFTESPATLFKFFRDALPQIESLLLLDQKKNRFELSGPGVSDAPCRWVQFSRQPLVVFPGESVS